MTLVPELCSLAYQPRCHQDAFFVHAGVTTPTFARTFTRSSRVILKRSG